MINYHQCAYPEGAITPEKLASSGTESGHQKAVFCWIAYNRPLYPALNDAFAIPNGGLREKRTAARMVAEGVRKGVPDIMLPHPNDYFHGLFIEMKRPKRGVVREEQSDYARRLTSNGYYCVVCRDWESCVNAMLDYLYRPGSLYSPARVG